MYNVQNYRDHARRLRVMAHETPVMHRELLEISEQYDRLADQVELLERPLDGGSGPASGPAVRRRAPTPRR